MAPMSGRLVLVRHGQASALSGDYDQLSELGKEQARRLGPWLARWASAPSCVMVGPRKRHRETYELALETSGGEWPPAMSVEALDEHHGIQLVHKIGSDLAARGDEIGEVARAAFSATAEPARAWLKLFRVVLLAYARGELAHDEIETWRAFRDRVRAVIDRGRQIDGTTIAFTSGGTTGAAVGAILGLDEARTLDLCWSIKNASVTELALGKHGPTLSTFNVTAHLDRADLITMV
jgi:broad specificity phosphatase PhoE